MHKCSKISRELWIHLYIIIYIICSEPVRFILSLWVKLPYNYLSRTSEIFRKVYSLSSWESEAWSDRELEQEKKSLENVTASLDLFLKV